MWKPDCSRLMAEAVSELIHVMGPKAGVDAMGQAARKLHPSAV